jgi:hypothetical protein
MGLARPPWRARVTMWHARIIPAAPVQPPGTPASRAGANEGKPGPRPPTYPESSVAAGGARWWRFQRRAEERRRRGGARSALREHSHRGCLSVAPAGRAASSSVRPGGEHRRSVGAFSARPRRCEPPPGTACRDARQRQGSSAPASDAHPGQADEARSAGLRAGTHRQTAPWTTRLVSDPQQKLQTPPPGRRSAGWRYRAG